MDNNDLIHRSAALAVLEELKNHVASPDPVGEVADAIETMRKVQAVDAVEVVRCRDCRHSIETSEQERELWGLSNDHMECCWFGSNVFANDFCSYGEREMDAEVEDET